MLLVNQVIRLKRMKAVCGESTREKNESFFNYYLVHFFYLVFKITLLK